MSELDSLTGNPYPDDLLRYALAVCAPLGAVQDYRYKCKLVPGAGKKGKAARNVIDLFLRQSAPGSSSAGTAGNINPLEKECIKGIPENELSTVMVSNARIAAAGASAAGSKGKGASSKPKKNKGANLDLSGATADAKLDD